MTRHFQELFAQKQSEGKFVSVGLDLDPSRLPSSVQGADIGRRCLAFAQAIVESTKDRVAAYKPNISYFEALGRDGMPVLQQIIRSIHAADSTIPVIVDAKRGDIASTNNGYVSSLFDYLEADATTLHPYLGHQALRPFLDQTTKGLFVLCRTSNPGAGEFQDLEIHGDPLYLWVARRVAREWNHNGNCGLVAGATYPKELARLRETAPSLPLLIPGIGAQGGDLEATVRASYADDRLNVIVNSSRAVLYASPGSDFAERAADEVGDLSNEILEVLAKLKTERP